MKNKILITSFIAVAASLANYAQAQSCQNCGLGTNIPHARLEIRGCTNDSTTGALKLTNSVDTTTTPLIYVRDDHRVGIGLANPSQALEVHGTIFSNTGGFKFPDGTTQTTASPITIGTGTSIINNLGGGNSSAAALSIIASGQNNVINGNADFGVILGGKNNTIENQSLNYSSSIPAPVNPGSHNFISGGEFNTIKPNANHAAIIGGRNNTVATGAANSIILGGSGITATEPNTVYMQKAAVTDLALPGSGNRILMVDSMGNFRASSTPQPPNSNSWSGNYWGTTGNYANTTDVLGTNNAVDLSIVTNKLERMHISQGSVGIGTVPNIIPSTRGNTNIVDPDPQYTLDVLGNIRVLIGGTTTDNIVLKAVHGNSEELDHPAIGIGTEDPVRALHIVTKHLIINPPPPPGCPTCLTGPHNGMRLEDFYKVSSSLTTNTIWDIAPEYNSTTHTGMLVIGTGVPNNNYTLNGKMMLLDNGNVGIGTADPIQTLDVNGRINVANGVIQKGGSPITTTGDLGLYSLDPATYMRFVTNGKPIRFYSDPTTTHPEGTTANMTIEPDGKVGIGIDPYYMTGNYRLYVKDGIMTEHCRVAIKGSPDWGDWVFAKNNKRMTFEEQLKYYAKNKHLKGIPSGDDLKKSGGIDVAEMFTGVVINLEEARLDAIQLHKDNQNQKDEINELKEFAKQQQKEMQDLKNELEKLKRK